MHKVSVDDMIKGKVNNYPLVVAVAKRAREITDEIIAKGEIITEKPVNLAFKEFKDHKYEIFESD